MVMSLQEAYKDMGNCPNCNAPVALPALVESVREVLPSEIILHCLKCGTPMSVGDDLKVRPAPAIEHRFAREMQEPSVPPGSSQSNAILNAKLDQIVMTGGVGQMIDTGPGGYRGILESSWTELGSIAQGGRHFLLCALASRPGMADALAAIENTLYPPSTPENHLFNLYHCGWENLLIHVAVVPIEDRAKVESVLKAKGFRVADGTPTLIEDGRVKHFPLSRHRTVFNLEPAVDSPRATIIPPTLQFPAPPSPKMLVQQSSSLGARPANLSHLSTPERLNAYVKMYGEKFADLWKKVEAARSERKGWPEWCYFPAYRCLRLLETYSPAVDQAMLNDVGVVSALAAWRMTKGIYRFDQTVFEDVSKTEVKGKLPIDVFFHLPEWCVYVETPDLHFLGASVKGFFAHLDPGPEFGALNMRLVLDTDKGLESIPLTLLEEGLRESISTSLKTARTALRAGPLREDQFANLAQATSGELEPIFSLLLYLCTINSDIRDSRGSDRRPKNPGYTKLKRGVRKMFAAPGVMTWEVGYRLGAAIRQAITERAARQPERGEGRHASPIPHIRRAHWHTFYTGPRKPSGADQLLTEQRKAFVKWLPPIKVNYDEAGEIMPTIHQVKQ